ncbi:MAG TPA: phosphate ABC transporter permease PstA [Acidiferrobacteraceae bacterium]|nr:phosphate ABC transporter permease PstA [Acidiferrobacteraceae bacterium]
MLPAAKLRWHGRRTLVGVFGWSAAALAFALVAFPLLNILWLVTREALGAFSPKLFTEVTNGISGGLLNAISGTFVLVAGSLAIAGPVGVLAGVYLSEFGDGTFGSAVRFFNDVLTGIPSIVLGYFSYVTMVVGLGWQFSVLAGSITLAIMIVPYLARLTELALRRVPNSLREAGYALGMREATVIARIVIPAALPGVLTAVLLSLAISVGETAPLIYTAGWSNYLWNGRFTHEPIGYLTYVIWSFINQPFASAHRLAFAAAFLVIALVLTLNVGVHLLLRRRGPER